jgi:hypothetical protein
MPLQCTRLVNVLTLPLPTLVDPELDHLASLSAAKLASFEPLFVTVVVSIVSAVATVVAAMSAPFLMPLQSSNFVLSDASVCSLVVIVSGHVDITPVSIASWTSESTSPHSRLPRVLDYQRRLRVVFVVGLPAGCGLAGMRL